MTKVIVTIEQIEGAEFNIKVQGEGKECNNQEVKVAQRVIKLISDEFHDHIIREIIPKIETIIPAIDRPQPN